MEITDLKGLAQHTDARWYGDKENLIKSIQHRLYKDTDCGVCFWSDGRSVRVSGYCEGVDGGCPSHELKFPFDSEAFDGIVKEADLDGCSLWDDTHGCEDCGPESEMGYRPVNEACPICEGCGTIL
jgi:hypothetical protein